MSKTRRKSTDRAILIACLLICLLSLPLFFEGIFTHVFSFGGDDAGSLIGSVLDPHKDIRIKSKNAVGWTTLRDRKTDLRLGSSVFSGAGSETTIKLENGLTINMKENSLIKFTKVGDLMVPEIGYGSFELSSASGVQIMKDGKLYTVQNTSLGGIRLVADQNGFRAYDASNSEIDISNGLLQSTAKMPVGATPSPIKAMDLLPSDQLVELDARLEDLYLPDAADASAYARKTSREIKHDLHFSWQTGATAMTQRVEHADNPQMKNARVFETQSQNQVLVDRLFTGSNYWRVMPDQSAWSDVQRFEVALKTFETRLRLSTKQKSPWISPPPNMLALLASGETHPDIVGLLIEVEHEGAPDDPRVFLFEPGKPLQVPLDQTGYYKIRAREVLKNRLISSLSNETRIEVLAPHLPDPPEFLGPAKLPLSLSQLTRLEWTSTAAAKQFDLEIHNLTTGEKQVRSVHENSLAFQSDSAGTFNVRVRMRDHFGQRSAWSQSKEIEVMAPISPPPLAQQAIENDFSNREKLPFPKPRPIFSNDTYDSDQVAAEISGYAMTSSEQKLMARDVALGSILGLRIRKNFFKQQAGEAQLRVQTIGFNDSAYSSLYSADMRYYYRLENNWFDSWKWRPFFSLGAGFEMFRSQNQQIFSPKYDLMKIGFRVNFPYRKSWTMGGDVFYGQATDSSTKVEVSGNFGYFFDHRFSAGLGYRVYFFDAATAASTPMGLPFREAFGEGYSVFRYHF